MSGFPNGHLKNSHFLWLYLKQMPSDAVCQHQLQKWSQFTLEYSPYPSSPTHLSLPEKMANYVRALCIHLFVVKTQQGVSSGMGKGSEGEAFCWERLEVWLGGGWAACWLEHADKMLFSRGSPWTQRLKGLTESEKQTDSLFFYRQRKKWMCRHYTDTRPWVPVVFESKVSFVSIFPFTGKAHFERRDLVYREWLHDLILA